MHHLHALPGWIRSQVGPRAIRGPAFWIATVLIALLVPSPIAAPVLLARFRRPPRSR